MKGAKAKGILIGLTAILLVSGAMGVAYATSTSDNNQNNFSDDEVDLWLKDQDDGWGDPVLATWVVTNMAPGDEFAFDASFVGLRSKFPKKVDMGWVNISCNYTVVGEPDSHADEMAKHMVITRFVYNNEEWEVQDYDNDDRVTFYDLKWSPVTNLPLPRKGKGARFEMSVRFHKDAGNEFQGDTFNLTMKYTLTTP